MSNINKKIYDVFIRKDLNNSQKTELLNKSLNKNWTTRTYQQRFKNYKDGFKDGIESNATDEQLERLANKEAKIIVQQKKNTFIKQKLHKDARKLAALDYVKEVVKEDLKKFDISVKNVVRKRRAPMGRLVEINMSDLQYKGGVDERNWVTYIFSQAISMLSQVKITPIDEVRFSMNGDDIEGDNAHESTLHEVTKLKIGQTRELIPLLISGINTFFSFVDGTENKSVVHVPFSNHGLVFGKGKSRYQFLDEDLGLVINDGLKLGLDKNIYLFPYDKDKMIVETEHDIYFHGHLGYNKNKKRESEVLGVDKNLKEAHLHHFEMLEERNRVRTLFPTCRMKSVRYERAAGYDPKPAITMIIQEGKEIISVERRLL